MHENHEVMAALLEEAHATHSRSRAVASYVVAELRRLEGSGVPWVSAQLAKWTVDGAMARCSTWRASQRTSARTKRGKDVDVAGWVGVPSRAPDGSIEHLSLPLDDVSLEQARAGVARMSKQRNTLSSTISVWERAIAHMEANPSCSFAEAVQVAA